MTVNLIDLTKGQLGAALISQLAQKSGKDELSISKAINALLPIVLERLISNIKKETLLNSIISASQNGLLSNLPEHSKNDENITWMVSEIFNDVNSTIDAVSSFSGIEHEKIRPLINLVTAAIIGSAGKLTIDNKLDKNQISALIEGQSKKLRSLIPNGLPLERLELKTFINGDSATACESSEIQSKNPNDTEEINPSPEIREESAKKESHLLLKWIVPLILLLCSAWILFKMKKNDRIETPTTDKTKEFKHNQLRNDSLKTDSILHSK